MTKSRLLQPDSGASRIYERGFVHHPRLGHRLSEDKPLLVRVEALEQHSLIWRMLVEELVEERWGT